MFACFHSRLSAVPRLAPVQANKQPRKSAQGRGWWLGQRRCAKACRQPATCVRGACAASGLRVPGQWWPRRTFLSHAPTSIISDCFCMHLRLEDEHVERLLRVLVHAAGELAVACVVCARVCQRGSVRGPTGAMVCRLRVAMAGCRPSITQGAEDGRRWPNRRFFPLVATFYTTRRSRGNFERARAAPPGLPTAGRSTDGPDGPRTGSPGKERG